MRRSLYAALALVISTSIAVTASSAPGDKSKPTKKPGTKGSASASVSAPAPPPSASSAEPEPTPPVDSAAASASASAAPSSSAASAPPPSENADPHDPTEKPGVWYYYAGLRYRGTILPQFLLNAFVDEGQTIYANSFGLEMDLRKDGLSRILHLTYADYNTGDMLFRNGDPGLIGNYSLVNSSMKALYLGADFLWSVHLNKILDFEYGAGIAVGATFGDLEVNWVKNDPNGSLKDNQGRHYSACNVGDTAPGCNPNEHQDTNNNPKNPLRVGHYNEPAWTSGGKKPSVLPNLSLPEVGVRIHPVKEFEARVGIGVSLYGFFFQLSGNYGLPIGESAKPQAGSSPQK